MRLLSVALTTQAVQERRKTVTRRIGWTFLKPGTRLTLCEKVQGRLNGEPLVRICDVEVVDVRRERLDAITAADVAAEGFPDLTPAEFVAFFCRHMRCTPDTLVTRICWRYLDEEATDV